MLERPHSILVTAIILVALAGAPATAILVGGGGSKRTDCLTVFDAPVNFKPAKPTQIKCTDGDATCDADGTVNGECRFPVAVCANSSFDPRCLYFGVQAVEVRHAEDDGDPKFDPEFQAVQSRIDNEIDPPTPDELCTAATNVHVPITGPFPGDSCRRGRKKLRLTTTQIPAGGLPKRDKDTLKMTCEPAETIGCDPAVLFAGTFDRIQRQILTPRCAIGGCHDSQSLAGGMTLESGSAYANLVSAPPLNGAANGAGWLRVTPGDADTSFLWHKLTGDLDTGMGGRMPFERPKLDGFLVDIIELWIDAGAPDTGWVPGTD